MIDGCVLAMLLAVPDALGRSGCGGTWPLAAIRVGERYRDFLDSSQRPIGAALVLVFAGLAVVRLRSLLAGLETPGDDAERRISETP